MQLTSGEERQSLLRLPYNSCRAWRGGLGSWLQVGRTASPPGAIKQLGR